MRPGFMSLAEWRSPKVKTTPVVQGQISIDVVLPVPSIAGEGGYGDSILPVGDVG